MMRARFISPAHADASEAAERYLNTDPEAGRRFFEELDRVTHLIETNPEDRPPGGARYVQVHAPAVSLRRRIRDLPARDRRSRRSAPSAGEIVLDIASEVDTPGWH
jgi:hypothetical protein